MVQKGILAVFEGSGISETGEVTPIKIGYSPWSEREFWPFLRVVVSPKPERSCPPKLVHMHNSSILTCMNFNNKE